MKRKQFLKREIIGLLEEAEAVAVVTELCRRHGPSAAPQLATQIVQRDLAPSFLQCQHRLPFHRG